MGHLSIFKGYMKLLTTIKSKIDKTVKFIFLMDDTLIMEMAYIDNNTGKDIICVSSQSACAMGCKLCHTTDYIGKLKVRNFTAEEITGGVRWVCNEMNLHLNTRMLLISYMGCGEPMLNVAHIVDSMIALRGMFSKIRFAIATMLPETHWVQFFTLTQAVREYALPVKIHLSLHSALEDCRGTLIPRALPIEPSIKALQFYQAATGNAVELHYALIKDVNDSHNDLTALFYLLHKSKIPIKFMPYNEKTTSVWKKGDILADYIELLIENGISHEFYTPPGLDVGASCGQFLFDYYVKYNKLQIPVSEFAISAGI